MKKIAIILAVLLIPIICVAQEKLTNVGFVGVRYSDQFEATNFDLKTKVTFYGGAGQNITGPLWTFEYVDLGVNGDVGFEVGAFTSLSFLNAPKFCIGFMAGPGADWIAEYDSAGANFDFIYYLRGAAGISLSYDITEAFGADLVGKYKFSGDNYPDGYIAALNLFYRY